MIVKLYYKVIQEVKHMATLSFRVDEDLEKAIRGQAKLENKTLSNYIVDVLRQNLEDEEDYKLAMASYNSIDMDDKTSLEDLCKEVGINYDEL